MAKSDKDNHKNSRLEQELAVLGIALREFREKSGLSMRDLAKKLKVSHNFVNRIESGEIKRRPSEEELNKLAEALGDLADDFRLKAGIVAPQMKDVLAKGKGYATTLELIDKKFTVMLQEKGLSDAEIRDVLMKVSGETIYRVVLEGEPIEIGFGNLSTDAVDAHKKKGYQVLEVISASAISDDSASNYLKENEADFSIDHTRTRSGRAQKTSEKPLYIEAGPKARIAVQGKITQQQKSMLAAIANVIERLLGR